MQPAHDQQPRNASEENAQLIRQEILGSRERVLRLARSLTRDPDEAADLVQATYVRVLERARTLRDNSNVLGWMLRTMRNLHLDTVRRPGYRCMPLGEEPRLVRDPIPAWRLVEDEEIEAVASTLIPVLRSVWELTHVYRLNQGDIAARLGIPRATVATRVFRARAAVRRGVSRNKRRSDLQVEMCDGASV